MINSLCRRLIGTLANISFKHIEKLADVSLYSFILVPLWNKQLFAYVNHARIRSWNQPVLSNESKVSCSRKQRGPLMGLELTTDRYPPITSQTRYPLRHPASVRVRHCPKTVMKYLQLMSELKWLRTISFVVIIYKRCKFMLM